jgi:uncharacterized protein (TIGR02466 family)
MSNTIQLFPTVIQYYEKLFTEKECLNLVNKCKKLKYKKHNALTNDAVSNHDLHNYVLHKFPKIKKVISEKIYSYSNELGVYNSEIDNSWVNFQYKKSKLRKHVHPNSKISGVLYLKTDEKSSKIYFYNPNPFNPFLNKKEQIHNNFEYVYFCPKIGDLILFPSWLSHGSHEEENLSEERAALSFNTI